MSALGLLPKLFTSRISRITWNASHSIRFNPNHAVLMPTYPFCSHRRFNSSTGFDNESLYHQEADRVMNVVTELCDELFDLTGDDFDYKTASGVLNIDFGSSGVFVLNKQAPNRELWLSSPISGPYHFQYDKENTKWVSGKDGKCLFDVLRTELSQTVGSEIEFTETF